MENISSENDNHKITVKESDIKQQLLNKLNEI